MIARFVMVAGMAAVIAVPGAAQQTPPAAPATPAGPNAGEVAPEFSAPGADKNGTFKAPLKLSDLKGKTVVLAFFPAARTRGCTEQMNQYRDQYAKLFNGGKDVVLLGVSTDADTTLANWAKEADFPFQFLSDKDRTIGLKYGTLTEARPTGSEARYVYVIGPDGKIAYTKKPFSPFTPPQYEELGAEIHKTLGSHH